MFGRDAEGRAILDGAPIERLLEAAGTPTPAYVYDLDGIRASARALNASFEGVPHLVAYAVKANSAGRIVQTLASEGCGADVVSGGGLELALGLGLSPDDIVFS